MQQGVKRSHSDMETTPSMPLATPVVSATPSSLAGVGPSVVTPVAAMQQPAQPTQPTHTQPIPTQATAGAPLAARAISSVPPPAKKPNLGPGATPHAVPGGPTQSTAFPSGVVYATATTTVPTVAVPTVAAAPAQIPREQERVHDAVGYLEKVKARFISAPVVYNQFLDIMKDFKSHNIDTEGVIKRVKSLFKGHRSLVLGFNQFLPPGYKIEFELEQAMDYVAKIKDRFRQEPYIYAEFLDILHNYQAKRVIDEVYQRVQKLFHGQPDLLDEFKKFLPESAVHIRGKPPVAKAQAAAKPSSQAAKSAAPTGVKRALMPPPKQVDAKGRPVPSSKAPSTAQPTEKVRKDAQGRIIPPSKTDAKSTKVSSSSSSTTPQPSASTAAPADRSVAGGSSAHRDGKTASSKEHRSSEHRHHHSSSSSSHAHAPRVTYPPGSEKELSLFERMKSHSTKAQWVQFLKVLNLFSNNLINRGELIRLVEDVYGDRNSSGAGDWVEKFKTTIGYDESEEKQLAAMNQTNYYAFVSSVDFTVCHQPTPSYRELPAQIQVTHASGRTEIGDEVLNDSCVSIPTGSEDFSFKSTRKNIYEENLFKCEDERFELDMLIENNAAAIRVLEPLVDQIAAMPPEQAKRVRLPDTIDILHIRAIARVYAEQGYEMVELLNKAPTVAAPTILGRLKQKDLEWRKIRNEMKSTWRKLNEQNYQRSLDHRSFYFKQEDKKRRSPKSLVVELKEVHQAVFGSSSALPAVKVEPVATRSQQDGKPAEKKPLPLFGFEDITGEESLMLRAIRQGQVPNPLYSYCMRFKYGDASIHAQLFDIVAKVCGITLASEVDQLKLLIFFATFVGEFFGVPVTAAQESRLTAMSDRVTAAEEERRAKEAESVDDKEKAASDALTDAKDAHDDDDENDMEDDSDGAKATAAASTPAAPHPASAAAAAARGGKGGAKKKTTKKKAATKKKPGVNPKHPSPVDPDEDDDDEEEKKKEDDDGDDTGSSARQRAAHAATQAANQLAAVKSLMQKIRAANDIGSESAATAATPLRPVKLHLDTPWLAEDKPSASHPVLRKHGRPSRLFLGSHAYYVFFRLHQFAYERLLTAKTLAHKARRNSSKKKLPVTAEERHARFAVMLDQLFDQEIESSKFEDECRNLLGAPSYVLFTIDKLIDQLVKQTGQLLASDNGLKVLSLYQYENRRVRTCIAQARKENPQAMPTEQISVLARQYESNIANLLGDDSACAIEYVRKQAHARHAGARDCARANLVTRLSPRSSVLLLLLLSSSSTTATSLASA